MEEYLIQVLVNEEKNLYAEYDPSGLSLDRGLIDYLVDCVENRKPGEKVSFEILSDTELDMERIRKAFLRFIDKHSSRNHHEMVRSQANALRLLGIGVLFIVLGILIAGQVNSVMAAIISTTGSFSVWEASAVWVETLPSLRKKERLLRRLAEAEIRYIRSE